MALTVRWLVAWRIARALDSGPLQAWFVDESMMIDPHVDVERELSRAEVVICAAIGAGALLGSGLVRFDGMLGVDRLVVPLIASLVVQVVVQEVASPLIDRPPCLSSWTNFSGVYQENRGLPIGQRLCGAESIA